MTIAYALSVNLPYSLREINTWHKYDTDPNYYSVFFCLKNSIALKKKTTQKLLLKRSPITIHTAQKGINPSKRKCKGRQKNACIRYNKHFKKCFFPKKWQKLHVTYHVVPWNVLANHILCSEATTSWKAF